MKMSDRKKKILQIVVDEYIKSATPVSSKQITEKHLKDISSATVRNELASLEELGYLTQFHTSGGRVPSAQAYRFYIEELMEHEDVSESDINRIGEMFNRRSGDVENIIHDVTKVISELTNYTSVGMTPSAEEETIRSMTLLPCGDDRALLVIITGERILRDSFISIPDGMNSDDVDNVSKMLSKLFAGKALSEARQVEASVIGEFTEYRIVVEEVLEALKSYARVRDEDIVLEGTDKIFNHREYEDIGNVKNFLSVISSKDKLAEMIGGGNDEIQINVKIGAAGEDDVPEDCSLVTATYSAGGRNLGTYGVIGPIRMDYQKVISVLENVGMALETIVQEKHAGTKEAPVLKEDKDERD